MSASPGNRWDTTACEVEAVAEQFIALVVKFDAAISNGHVPPIFVERAAELRHTAERLIEP